ncbi:rod shape-determining protein MreC [Shewanella sp. 11B5]|jgi:rod shape-determining protein MreC|uniref:Cell shape-determining protein MreC n=1 Tax=Shewanella frigidimarina (strain NCIMB 400) TaxID=318167 RepID=Q07WQ0_SHEFN|nr:MULTISPECIES: rod shape-determining protein MreC [Shewanella]ABI73564.1 rod shape-determining protein MreC [Shewanella frigidimarina NCIMB 400]PKI07495.1 rod shape-determining protein MreC [Shewanella sp. 11B5]|tara:strand:+ start:34483 stop:35445 length:963 start_codon:yes stop_codon:yes gene_type:complete
MKPIFVRGVSSQFRLTLAIILSVALLMTNNRLDPIRQSLSSVLSPLQYLANVPGVMLDWSAEAFATRNMLELQNKELLRQQLVMSERLQRFEHVRQENERLRALLGSPVHMDSRKMVAEVMEVASDPFRQFVVLNHGSQTGIYVGQPVVDAQGVVGQVVEVSEFTSRVLMVSDTTHGIPVRVTRNDVRAIANGMGDIDQIELRHVAKSTDIIVGDLLVTSGLGNRFPEGYPVARVISVSRDDGQSYAVIYAQPLAALDRIRYVLLIWPDETKPFTLPNDVQELIKEAADKAAATANSSEPQPQPQPVETTTTPVTSEVNQ